MLTIVQSFNTTYYKHALGGDHVIPNRSSGIVKFPARSIVGAFPTVTLTLCRLFK